MTESKSNVSTEAVAKKPASKVNREISEFLKAGVQFGHETKRWNPKMKPYIFTTKNNIHIIDIDKSMDSLAKAIAFLEHAASEGVVLFVGTKRQATDIVKEEAIKAGGNYIINRWPGGLLTNFDQIKQSLKKYKELEREFQEGVEGRTKFEVSNMKKEWVKINRLYEGVKTMDSFPKALVVVDVNYERNVITEAKKLGIPVVAIVDTNSDPDAVEYPIPGNDDAISSLRLLIGVLGEAVKNGNKGKGVKHEFVDYSKYEVKIKKVEEKKEEVVEVGELLEPKVMEVKKVKSEKKGEDNKGILENIQKEKEIKRQARASKEREKEGK